MTDYLITYNPDSEYFQHFNRNHDKKSGRFTFGDGDGDGTVNERKTKDTKVKKESNLQELRKFYVKNAKINPEFTRLSTEASSTDTLRKVGTGVLAGGLGIGAVLAGAAFLAESPVLLGPAVGLAYASTIYGGGTVVGSFIEEARLTRIKKDFEEFHLSDSQNPTVNIKKK